MVQEPQQQHTLLDRIRQHRVILTLSALATLVIVVGDFIGALETIHTFAVKNIPNMWRTFTQTMSSAISLVGAQLGHKWIWVLVVVLLVVGIAVSLSQRRHWVQHVFGILHKVVTAARTRIRALKPKWLVPAISAILLLSVTGIVVLNGLDAIGNSSMDKSGSGPSLTLTSGLGVTATAVGVPPTTPNPSGTATSRTSMTPTAIASRTPTTTPVGTVNLVQTTAAIAGTSTTISQTFGNATTTSNLIVVGLIVGSASAPGTSVTDSKGNRYTKLFSIGNNTGWTELYYAYNITGGSSFSVKINNPNYFGVNGFAREYSGIQSSSDPLDQWTTATGSTSSMSAGPTTATTHANDLIIGVFGDNWGNVLTYTAGTGFGNFIKNSTGAAGDISMEDRVVSSTGTQTVSETVSQPPSWVAGVIAFKGASSGT